MNWAISCAVLLALVDARAQDASERPRRFAKIFLIAEEGEGSVTFGPKAGETVLSWEVDGHRLPDHRGAFGRRWWLQSGARELRGENRTKRRILGTAYG